MEPFRVRLDCVDHYQSRAGPFDPPLPTDGLAPDQPADSDVPVIRVFGSTAAGQKACVHFHGLFPYLYVEYAGSPSPDLVDEYVRELQVAIDHALAASYRRGDLRAGGRYVARITLVKGVPFYGYHVGYKYFLKIYILNPSTMTRLAEMLRQGAIMGTIFQPYEAHLDFILQWMVDYNLYGCGYIDCRQAFPRGTPAGGVALPRISYCAIEVDVYAHDILNRLEITPRPLHQDFSEWLNPVPFDQKLVPSMESLWRDEKRRRKMHDSGGSQIPFDVMPADSRSPLDGWVHQEEYMDKVRAIIIEEKNNRGDARLSLDTFVPQSPFDSSIKTALDAVADFYPEDLSSDIGSTQDGVLQHLNCDKQPPLDVQKPVDLPHSSSFPDLKTTPHDLKRPRSHSLSKDTNNKRHKVKLTDDENPPISDVSTEKEVLSRHPLASKTGSQSDLIDEIVIDSIANEFGAASSKVLVFRKLPPGSVDVSTSMGSFGLPEIIYQDAYYSDEADVPGRVMEWAGRQFKLGSVTVPFLSDFDATASSAATFGVKSAVAYDRNKIEAGFQRRRRNCSLRSWEISDPPPSCAEVTVWAQTEDSDMLSPTGACSRQRESSDVKTKLSQIEGATQRNKHGFKYTQIQKSPNAQHETHGMSIMSLEIHVNTRDDFVPNPEEDAVQCVFWCLQSAENGLEGGVTAENTHTGIVVLSGDSNAKRNLARQVIGEVQVEASERDVLVRTVEVVRRHDPDILAGFEIHNSSWGYLIERAQLRYGYDLVHDFSRIKSASGRSGSEWESRTTSRVQVTGRHTINIWRAMRSEVNLLQYTLENVVFHLLHRRIPHYAWRDLTRWYAGGRPDELAKVLNYYVSRVQLNLEIMEQNELIYRVSEQARLLGVDFWSVFSRGSQFKVESLMFRIAKPENFLLVSPSKKQVGEQNALECLPLVMEPQSAFYTSPVLVLDFQSLYPSIMIAYNYCYSTYLGRAADWRGRNKMGFTEYQRPDGLLEQLGDHINIAPNGMLYVKPAVRQSLLGRMLDEILATRVMVKGAMQRHGHDKALQRQLNNRQLALKLIANVTYGYTSASFSGRMPCAEIADSIVQTGRETLERAAALIHAHAAWDAEIVYGDTDSLFVHLRGRTTAQAFAVGAEMAERVTRANPWPVRLRLEKVYQPCVLLAKKRYVGRRYETAQRAPEFEAKGIETVRRDGTPAAQRIQEQALKTLFATADLSRVKAYVQAQWAKILRGAVSLQDFCFAREVRLGTYGAPAHQPPGALVSARRMRRDQRAEPQYGERVPYVVVAGAPGERLADRCVAPETMLHGGRRVLDADYYISKNIIPPLDRIFRLAGADVRRWYDEMPKTQRGRAAGRRSRLAAATALEAYLQTSSCAVCHDKAEPAAEPAAAPAAPASEPLCSRCRGNAPSSLLALQSRLALAERQAQDVDAVCRSCAGLAWRDAVACDSYDCPVFYTRTKLRARLQAEQARAVPVMRSLEGRAAAAEALAW